MEMNSKRYFEHAEKQTESCCCHKGLSVPSMLGDEE
jgi:hypothetical protein